MLWGMNGSSHFRIEIYYIFKDHLAKSIPLHWIAFVPLSKILCPYMCEGISGYFNLFFFFFAHFYVNTTLSQLLWVYKQSWNLIILVRQLGSVSKLNFPQLHLVIFRVQVLGIFWQIYSQVLNMFKAIINGIFKFQFENFHCYCIEIRLVFKKSISYLANLLKAL